MNVLTNWGCTGCSLDRWEYNTGHSTGQTERVAMGVSAGNREVQHWAFTWVDKVLSRYMVP